MRSPAYDLYPGSNVRGALLSGYQSIGDATELQLVALWNNRQKTSSMAYPTSYFKSTPDTTNFIVAPSIHFSLPLDWSPTLGGTYGQDEVKHLDTMVDTVVGESTVVSKGCYCNEGLSYDIAGEGPVFTLPAGTARLALGAGYRKNVLSDEFYLAADGFRNHFEQGVRFAYGEVRVPIVSAAMDIAGANRLDFNAALRTEEYDSFGRVTTPTIGFSYAPTQDFTLKTSWGKSFKAPTLMQQYSSSAVYVWPASAVGGLGYPADATALMRSGGNRELTAERARSWTAALNFHPRALPRLNAELAYFSIDYSDRVVRGVPSYWFALSDPLYTDFVNRSPTLEQVLATYSSGSINNFSGADFDSATVVAIIDSR